MSMTLNLWTDFAMLVYGVLAGISLVVLLTAHMKG
jgi:hypothetical protein